MARYLASHVARGQWTDGGRRTIARMDRAECLKPVALETCARPPAKTTHGGGADDDDATSLVPPASSLAASPLIGLAATPLAVAEDTAASSALVYALSAVCISPAASAACALSTLRGTNAHDALRRTAPCHATNATASGAPRAFTRSRPRSSCRVMCRARMIN